MDKKPIRSDWYIIAIFFMISIVITLFGSDNYDSIYLRVYDTAVYVLSAISVTYLIVYVLFPKYFPQRKIFVLLFWIVLVMTLVGVIEYFAYRIVNGIEMKQLQAFYKPKLYLWAVISSSENAGILVGILLGKKFYDVQLDMEKKEKEIRTSELRRLKAQVDPHFLFNNLNTVDALIDSDPKVAKSYLKHLSELYRYLIKTKDDEVVGLDEELEFAQNYVYLIEKRFGGAFQFVIEAQNGTVDYLIPPGALQTVLENVVKHNSGSNESPITTYITLDGDFLNVKNNKISRVKSQAKSGTGLNNLIARYTLLTDKKVQVSDDVSYTISLPILKSID